MARFLSVLSDSPSRAARPDRSRPTNLVAGAVVLAAVLAIVFVMNGLILQRTIQVAGEITQQHEAAFAETDLLTRRTKQQLRSFPNREHVERAAAMGIAPLHDRAAAAQFIADTAGGPRLVRVETNPLYIMDPAMSYGVPYVVPDMHRLLEQIGRRFQERLKEQGLPPYRYLITSVLRTTADQAALRGVNVNAAGGTSSHEHGTTADLHYRLFDYAAALDSLPSGPSIDESLLADRVARAATRLAKAHPKVLKAVLGRVLHDLQEEGTVMVTYERRQPVYHITVAAPVDALAEAR